MIIWSWGWEEWEWTGKVEQRCLSCCVIARTKYSTHALKEEKLILVHSLWRFQYILNVSRPLVWQRGMVKETWCGMAGKRWQAVSLSFPFIPCRLQAFWMGPPAPTVGLLIIHTQSQSVDWWVWAHKPWQRDEWKMWETVNISVGNPSDLTERTEAPNWLRSPDLLRNNKGKSSVECKYLFWVARQASKAWWQLS